MESGIYKITNIITGKSYVGSAKNFEFRWQRHFNDLRNGKHSSIKLQRSYDKHGESVFIPQVLERLEYQKDLIIARENFWISQLNSKIDGYNIADASFGDTISTHPNKDVIIQKIKNTINRNMTQMTPDERKQKYGHSGANNGMFGKTHTRETKQLLSAINKNNTYRLGKKLTDDAVRAKLSKIASERIGTFNPFYGKTHSQESKDKIALKAKGRRNTACHKAVVVNGVQYSCLNDAALATNIKATTIWHRCRSANKKFKDTYLIEH